MGNLESYFSRFRNNIIGINTQFDSPYGKKTVLYADWIASGRMYSKIEDALRNKFYPFVANTHTDSTVTGASMTHAYHHALNSIKKHVNADADDVIISAYSGMTGVINKFQRILGLRIHENFKPLFDVNDVEKPIVFITHMEHHSNQTSWLETICDVEIIDPDDNGEVSTNSLKVLLEKYKSRKIKIAAVTSCSNVTGIFTPYHQIAKIMHEHDGLCFVDFACSAPYIDINMHPKDPLESLDAIYFSPHKFLGGPATAGVLLFKKSLYKNKIPDNPGGGTVDWTNPWGEHKYIDDITAREDGGTPSFIQTIKTALCINLKDQMGVENIAKREHELLEQAFSRLEKNKKVEILADNIKNRLGVISFYITGLHYNLAVKILNDRFGIQVRGGCSCAGTYGHYLLSVTKDFSSQITCAINSGDNSSKPGWIRLSLHPTMSDSELLIILDAIDELSEKYPDWISEYTYSNDTNSFCHSSDLENNKLTSDVEEWFNLN